jgi:DAACS family dicarboxylate/amino acid:cation (Na+ or H+) symporter
MMEGAGQLGVDTLVGLVPTNPVRAAADMQMLPLIVFSLIFGLALAQVPGERRLPMLDLLEALAAVVMKIIGGVLWIAPVGVFALIFVATSRFGWDLLEQLGLYVLAVVAGLLVHGGVVLSAMVGILGRTSPLRFWKGARAALITAFSTSSSNATLPTTMEVAERELGVARPVARFVLPLGATLNMNGTALYEGVSVLFLAGVFGVELGFEQQVTVLLMCVLTAVGTAGVPGGSLPLLMGVLAAVGVPPEGIGVILGVDRILDMCRTLLNVTGDLAVSMVVGRVEDNAHRHAHPSGLDP